MSEVAPINLLSFEALTVTEISGKPISTLLLFESFQMMDHRYDVLDGLDALQLNANSNYCNWDTGEAVIDEEPVEIDPLFEFDAPQYFDFLQLQRQIDDQSGLETLALPSGEEYVSVEFVGLKVTFTGS